MQTYGEATVEECGSRVEIHEVDRREKHAEIAALDVYFQGVQADAVEQFLVEVIAQREVADLHERSILEAEQT